MSRSGKMYNHEQLDEQGGRLPGPARRAAQQERTANAAAVKSAELEAGGGQAAVQSQLRQRYGGRMPSQRQLARHGSGALTANRVAATGRENLFRGGGGESAMRDKGLTRQQVMAQGVKNMEAKPTAASGTQRPAPAAAAPPKDVIVKAAKGGVPGTLNKTTGKWTASAPAAAAPTKPSAPLADKVTPATKPTTSYAGATGVKPVGTPIQGGVKPVAGAPTQASLSTAKPEEKANILGNKASELAALQAKAKADTMARRQTTQRPMGPRGM